MFRSRIVASVKPSSSCRTVLILGMGKRVSHYLVVYFPKIANDPYGVFFGMLKVGKAHSGSACHFKTPKLHSLLISFFKVSACFFGIGNGLPWLVVLPLSWSETGLQSQSPSVPSYSSSNSCRSFSNLYFSVALRWLRHSSLVIALQFAFSYLASKI